MLDRTIAPTAKEIRSISYIEPQQYTLSNGIPVYGINAGSQDLVKIEFIFGAGTWYQQANLVAGLTNAFLNEGSQNFTAQQIAEVFDTRGAYLQLSADQQWADVCILTLNKYIDDILEVTANIIQHPTFPEREIAFQIEKKKQRYLIENEKVKTLAQKKLSQVLFGEKHPYANTNCLKDYDQISIAQLTDFHRKYYTPSNCKILISGRFDDTLYAKLDFFFGDYAWPCSEKQVEPSHIIMPSQQRCHFVEKENAIQSAIRMGCSAPNRFDADYHGMIILSTILGGYFGSRLMNNIREEKGYTYGIGSGLLADPHGCYFLIATEVGKDVCKPALTEIYKEIDRLCNDLVPENELNMVRHYLQGEMLRSFDGIFAISGSIRTLLDFGLDRAHYTDFLNEISDINAERLRTLAQTYLNKNSIYEVIAGSEQ